MEALLDAATVEVRYNRGIVYFDHCGTLMLALEQALGATFRGSVPAMVEAYLNSDAEHLRVTYSPKSFVVTQRWIKAPVRVEQVSPIVWKHVAAKLNVGSEVTRCGVRFEFTWPIADVEEGHRRLAASGLMAPTPKWSELFGATKAQTYTGVSEDHRGARVRSHLDLIERKTEGYIPEELRAKMAPVAIQLDVDNVYPAPKQPYSLGEGQLKTFMRESWSKSRDLAEAVERAVQVNQ